MELVLAKIGLKIALKTLWKRGLRVCFLFLLAIGMLSSPHIRDFSTCLNPEDSLTLSEHSFILQNNKLKSTQFFQATGEFSCVDRIECEDILAPTRSILDRLALKKTLQDNFVVHFSLSHFEWLSFVRSLTPSDLPPTQKHFVGELSALINPAVLILPYIKLTI